MKSTKIFSLMLFTVLFTITSSRAIDKSDRVKRLADFAGIYQRGMAQYSNAMSYLYNNGYYGNNYNTNSYNNGYGTDYYNNGYNNGYGTNYNNGYGTNYNNGYNYNSGYSYPFVHYGGTTPFVHVGGTAPLVLRGRK